MKPLTSLLEPLKMSFADGSAIKAAKRANTVLLLGWRLLIASVIIWCVWRFRSVSENDTYALKAFSVPPDLEKRGYQGNTVVAKILSDMLAIIYPKDSSTSRFNACRQNEKVRLKTQLKVADGSASDKVDINYLVETSKMLIGREDKVITGHIIHESDQWKAYIKIEDKPLHTIAISDLMPLDSLYFKAAFYLVGETTPQYLVNYLIQAKRFDEAETLLASLSFKQNDNENTPKAERIQTLTNWANFHLSKDSFRLAYQKAEELHQLFPNDLSSYALRVSILMAHATDMTFKNPDTKEIKPLAERAFHVAMSAEKIENKMTSLYLNKQHALGLMLSNAGYLASMCHLQEAPILEKYLLRAKQILPHNLYLRNNLAYFYLNQKNYILAEKYAREAVEADRNDGNLWDTYAEIMLKANNPVRCYEYLDKALEHSKVVDGITVAEYKKDARWETLRKMDNAKQFNSLLKKHDGYAANIMGAFAPKAN